MKKVCLLVFIAIVNLWMVGEILAQETVVQRRGMTVTSPTGVRPVPDEIRNAPQRIPDNIAIGGDVPDHIVYQFMFRQLILMSQTDGKQGVNCYGKPLSPAFKANANLSGKQYKSLLKIANETTIEVEELEQKAIPIIREFRAKMMSGRPAPGDRRPPPPPELEALNKQKIELLEAAIDKIKTSFGEKDFAGFSEFVDKNFRFGITRATIKTPL